MGKKVVHIEFAAQDMNRAQKFWEGVGGWSIADSGMPGIDYRMFQEGDQGGALMESDTKGPVVYLGSDDIDADLGKVSELRGRGRREATDPSRRVVRPLQGHRGQCLQPVPE